MDDLLTIPASFPAQVLLVEDDSRLEEILTASMQEDNIVVTRAGGGREALQWLAQSKFDLILLDEASQMDVLLKATGCVQLRT